MIGRRRVTLFIFLVSALITPSAVGSSLLSYHDGCKMPGELGMFDVESLEISVAEDLNYTLVVKLCERQSPFIGLLNPEPITHGLWVDYDSDEGTGVSWPDYKGIDYEIYTLTECNGTRCVIRTYLRFLATKRSVTFVIGEKEMYWRYSEKYSLELPTFVLDPEKSRFAYIMVSSFRDEISRHVRRVTNRLLEISDPCEKLPIDVKGVRILTLHKKLVINYTFYGILPSLNEGGVVCWLPALSLDKGLIAPIFWLTSTPPYNLTGIIFLNFTHEPLYLSHLYKNKATYEVDASKLKIRNHTLRLLPLMVCHVYDVVPDKGWLSFKNKVQG